MKSIKIIIAISLMVVFAAVSLIACSSAATETSEQTGESQKAETTTAETTVAKTTVEETETEVQLKTIGTENGVDSQIEIVNNTGDDIVFLTLIKDDQEEINMLPDGDVFANKEHRILFYQAEDNTDAAVQEFPDFKLIISVKSGQDAKSTLSAFPVKDAEIVNIEYDSSSYLPYLSYKSIETGSNVSTLLAEQAIAEAAAREAEEAERAAEESRAAEEAAMYSFDDDSYNDGGYDDYDDYDYDDYSGDSEDGCIEDGMFF